MTNKPDVAPGYVQPPPTNDPATYPFVDPVWGAVTGDDQYSVLGMRLLYQPEDAAGFTDVEADAVIVPRDYNPYIDPDLNDPLEDDPSQAAINEVETTTGGAATAFSADDVQFDDSDISDDEAAAAHSRMLAWLTGEGDDEAV